MERTYAGLQRPDFEREPPDCEGCLSRDAMLDELQRDRDQYVAWYALADAERRQAQAEVERLRADAARYRWLKSVEGWDDAAIDAARGES